MSTARLSASDNKTASGAAPTEQGDKLSGLSFGLSDSEVVQRTQAGQVNRTPTRTSRSLREILFANVVTPFNGLLMLLATVVVLVDQGSPINALFGVVIVVNSGIGVFQEVRAKRTLDKLAILSAPRARVVRSGEERDIAVDEVVLGDVLHLSLGDQIVADGKLIANNEIEIDESLLTGESDPVSKNIGDEALSGSLVVAGSGYLEVTAVGEDAYSFKIMADAKRFKRAPSELIAGTNKLLKWISWMLVIVAPILVWGQLRLDEVEWQRSIVRATAAIVGMIPEGLVLLTSMAFMLAAMVLAGRKVLVQQMPAVEGLARVDTLLLDKTGTLTEGTIRFESLQIIPDQDDTGQDDAGQEYTERVLCTMASRVVSPTNNAISEAYAAVKLLDFSAEVPFSSARKWSALTIEGQSWILGAPEILFCKGVDAKTDQALARAHELANQGKRVLALGLTLSQPEPNILPSSFKPDPRALIVLSENIRSDAAETLSYFAQQGVDIKIISGDNPLTVAAVGRLVGVNAQTAFDARELPDSGTECLDIIHNNTVFGRVQPEQKRRIARLLQAEGHVVAMTGDGVNDALALKDADIGIAMNSGASATKAVAELVLMDNSFSHLPSVLAEGRRVIANIERVANLFVIKNVYSLMLALAVTVAGLMDPRLGSYPYLPVQMTVISALTIGIPAFFLALAPNQRLYRPGFLKRVLSFAVPVGIISAAAMMVNYYLVTASGTVSQAAAGTATTIVALLVGLAVICGLARPLKPWKILLLMGIAGVSAAMILLEPLAHIVGYQLEPAIMPTTLIPAAVAMILVIIIQQLMLGKHRFIHYPPSRT